jgi:hypothetical protein
LGVAAELTDGGIESGMWISGSERTAVATPPFSGVDPDAPFSPRRSDISPLASERENARPHELQKFASVVGVPQWIQNFSGMAG